MINETNKERFSPLVKDKVGFNMSGHGTIGYNDELHVYWSEGTFDQAISVTTLLHDYGEKFDGEFWLRFKALEDLCGGKETFKSNPLRKKLISSKAWNDEYITESSILKEDFDAKVEEIQQQWNDKNKKATDFGTEYHLQKELGIYDKNKELFESLGIDDTFVVINGAEGVDIREYENAIFPELLVSYYMEKGIANVFVAGQADIVVKKGNEIWILDYKTNEKIDFTAFMNKKMKHPANNHQDCSYGHYSLQLSIYAHFIEEAFGIPVTKTELIHIERDDIDVERKKAKRLETKRYPEFHPNYSGEVVHYKVPCDRDAAKAIIQDMYKKNLKKEEEAFNLDNLWD